MLGQFDITSRLYVYRKTLLYEREFAEVSHQVNAKVTDDFKEKMSLQRLHELSCDQATYHSISPVLQGDTSGKFKPPVDIKIKVAFQ